MDFPLSDVIQVQAISPGAGASEYNTSNLALFTPDARANSFGLLGYKLYLSPTGADLDFGSSSKVFELINAVFSQQPNILIGGGYLAVIPLIIDIQDLALSGIPASGSFVVNFGGHASAAINWNDTALQAQAKIQAILGLEQATVTGSLASQDIKIHFFGYYGPALAVTISANSLQTGALAPITFIISHDVVGETLAAAITRTKNLVQYFGIIESFLVPEADGLAAAAIVQPLNKILGVVSDVAGDVSPGGYLDLLRSGGFDQTRGLFYGGSLSDPLLFLADYFSRGLSTNFEGSQTTQDMNLKSLIGLQPDDSIDETLKAACKLAGADIYISYEGVAKVAASGKNRFFDQVYNELWQLGDMQVAYFNVLAQVGTKIAQTEDGMTAILGAIRESLARGVKNGYLAPGSWTFPIPFGNPADLIANIAQAGYYIFSQPISQQDPAQRALRAAPLIQVAGKEAGAIDSGSVLFEVNP